MQPWLLYELGGVSHRKNFFMKRGLGYKKKIFNDKEIIIFFSGMLSGQYPLDNGSFNRLKWHIKYVKKIKLQ